MKNNMTRGLLAALLERAGRGYSLGVRGDESGSRETAQRGGGATYEGMETLEPRVMLSGDDHPDFFEVFRPLNPLVATPITLNGAGQGSATGEITQMDDDMFRFTAPANDFVTVLADTIGEAGDLNSAVRVYTRDVLGGAVLVATGNDNGTLTTGLATDGWTGFVAEAGVEYFVRVLSEAATLGSYTLRLDARTDALTIDPATGEVTQAGTITRVQQDVVYVVEAGSDADFGSLATAVARADATDLDTRLDIYDASGARIASDSLSGFLSSAFTFWRSEADERFYVRVRSDDLRDPATFPSTGAFTLVVDLRAQDLDTPVDPVTRRGNAVAILTDPNDTRLFRFDSQGTGLHFITGLSNPLAPDDVALRVYNAAGAFIGFNDDFSGIDAQVQIQLVGGLEYFVVVEGFDDAATGPIQLFVEAHHTFAPSQPVDDHINLPTTGTALERRRLLELATPIIWGDPTQPLDAMGNPIDDHTTIVTGALQGRIHTATDTDVFQFVPPTDMLGEYPGEDDGGDPPAWLPDDRGASRIQIIVTGFADSFLNTQIQVLDSNLATIYTNTTIAPPFPDPSGALDDSLSGPDVPGDLMFEVWGGEVYYLVISGESGTGRYAGLVQVDGVPADTDQDGVHDDAISDIFEMVGAGQWSAAREMMLDLASGDDLNYSAAGGPPIHGDQIRAYDLYPSNFLVTQAGDYESIHHVTDTDLYFFIAPATGTVEVRVNTTGINDEWLEEIVDLNQFPPAVEYLAKTKTYNSPLDSALRIFNNDFIQLGYNNDNAAVEGEFQVTDTGSLADVTYFRRDAAISFHVEVGEKYFIQVESGQAEAYAQDPGLVDWRRATGSYRLFLNTPPNLNFIDDHENLNVDLFSPIPIIQEQGNPANGTGSVSGIIDNDALFNPNDLDGFSFYAPSRGQYTVRVAPTGATLSPAVLVLNETIDIVTQRTAAAGQTAVLTFFAEQGQKFYVNIDGAGSSEGGYTLSLQGPPFVDDYADAHRWAEAHELDISTFFGTAELTGSLEAPGDTDLFVFTAGDFDVARITINSLSADTLDPFVRVFEVGQDGTVEVLGGAAEHPVFLQIAFNDDISGTDLDSSVPFSVSRGRQYYVLVSGFDAEVDYGNYTLVLQTTPTDDHPNIGDYPLASAISLTFNSLSGAFEGTQGGVIEVDTDDDLFVFTTPADGDARIVISTPDSGLAVRVEARTAGNVLISAVEGTAGEAELDLTGLVAGSQVYVLVDVGTSDDVDEPDLTGAYSVFVAATPVDDHPDEGEFGIATVVTLSPTTGIGTSSGIILPVGDTDLFTFTTLEAGSTDVIVSTPGSTLNPSFRVFNSSFVVIGTAVSDGNTASFTFEAGAGDEVYYILVEPASGSSGIQLNGAFGLTVDGQVEDGGGGGPTDDHPNRGEFGAVGPSDTINLDARTGDGTITGVIDSIGDSDLFRFTTLDAGPVFLQVVVPSGSFLDAAVTVYNSNRQVIAQNSLGLPGATAAVEFTAPAGALYYVLVDQVDVNVGSYIIKLDSEPTTHFLYHPEGFTSNTIDEFVPIVNPNDFAVTYSVFARYETGVRDQLIASGTIAANSRGGITISTRSNPNGGLVRKNEPYSLEIRSNGQLGATLSHYDFGITTGESFTNEVSTVWTFSQAHKDEVNFRDFLVFYNPNDAAATVTVTLYYENGTVTSFSQSLASLRRGGVGFNSDTRVTQQGVFGVKVESTLPIVAALSSFDIVNGRGYGIIGEPGEGALEGAVPFVFQGSGTSGELAILNTTDSPATVTVRVSYQRADLPDLTRVISVTARGQRTFSLAALGLADSQIAGLRYTSTAPVTVMVSEFRNGDADATGAATEAAQTFVFGDAFVNSNFAGITYIENIALYNPANVPVTVTMTFLFADGTTATAAPISVGADDFNYISVDQQPAILNGGGPTAFSIRLDAATPFVAAFNHYDLFLNGGWGALGAPIGLTNPLVTI